MFDYIRCEIPLPVEGHQDRTYQTKETPTQELDTYIIRDDGYVWLGDHRCTFTEVVRFYGFYHDNPSPGRGWVKFEAIVVDGHVQDIRTVEIREE